MKSLLSVFLVYCSLHFGQGSVPDASQEGLLNQYTSYASLALFHYVVPPEVTRATWEFASFQDKVNCPSREANIVLQHGSYPVFSADNSSFPDSFYLKRTSLSKLKTMSRFQPSDSVVQAVYNPLPGNWFVVAYLSPYEKRHGLLKGCKYSLGSIALWSKADNVELLIPNQKQTFRTRRHFSYYKFHIDDAVDAFRLVISNCVVRVRLKRPKLSENICLDYVDIRARALPFHDLSSSSAQRNISSNESVVFFEARPKKPSMFYVIVISHGEVTFDMHVSLKDCGETGLYGKQQKNWFMNERGLILSDSYNQSVTPKEPQTGFQLLSTKLSNIQANVTKENYVFDQNSPLWTKEENETFNENCLSTFDFTRVDNPDEFTVNYMLQGRSWYTRWLTVIENAELLTRFDVIDFVDLGGFVNINISMDTSKMNHHMYQKILACLSKDRIPDISHCEPEALMTVSDHSKETLSAYKVIPYPEPGKWYIGFKIICVARFKERVEPCPGNLKGSMISLNIHMQPCDYRPLHDICGPYGVCAKATKGRFRFSSCTCLAGHKGWTCDDTSDISQPWLFLTQTLLLTLSNLAFLPAVILSLYYKLFTESLIYTATMVFSTFYHMCDQEALTAKLPPVLENACMAFYINREVLQFSDFFTATLSFWVTIISLARLPHKLVNFLNMFGVLLIAVLVQYNRTSVAIFAIPIPLGIFVLIVALQVKGFHRKKVVLPNKLCALLFIPAATCSVIALGLVGFLETSINYTYIHSAWHGLIAISLLFLLPLCKEKSKKKCNPDPGIPNEPNSNSCSSLSSMSSEEIVETTSESSSEDNKKSDDVQSLSQPVPV